MPYSRKSANRKRSSYRPRKRRYTAKRRLNFRTMPLAFPKSKIVKMRYVSEKHYNAGSSFATSSTNVFSANGCFDPDVTGVGHQPLGFDQWMAVYDHYQVIGSKITVQWMPDTTSNQVPAYVGIVLSDSTTAPSAAYSSLEHWLESRQLGMNGRALMNCGIVSGTSLQGFHNPGINKYFSSKKFFRRPANESSLRGDPSSNPSDGAFFIVTAATSGGADPGTINLLVTIDYIVRLTEPKELAQS